MAKENIMDHLHPSLSKAFIVHFLLYAYCVWVSPPILLAKKKKKVWSKTLCEVNRLLFWLLYNTHSQFYIPMHLFLFCFSTTLFLWIAFSLWYYTPLTFHHRYNRSFLIANVTSMIRQDIFSLILLKEARMLAARSLALSGGIFIHKYRCIHLCPTNAFRVTDSITMKWYSIQNFCSVFFNVLILPCISWSLLYKLKLHSHSFHGSITSVT